MRRSTILYPLLSPTLGSGNDAGLAEVVACSRRVEIYPLAQAANPPLTTFVDSIDVVSDATIPYDLRFFQSLDRIVQNELRLARDKALIDRLKWIGIEKGKPFNPDVKTQDIHKEATHKAHAWFDARHHGPMAL